MKRKREGRERESMGEVCALLVSAVGSLFAACPGICRSPSGHWGGTVRVIVSGLCAAVCGGGGRGFSCWPEATYHPRHDSEVVR